MMVTMVESTGKFRESILIYQNRSYFPGFCYPYYKSLIWLIEIKSVAIEVS